MDNSSRMTHQATVLSWRCDVLLVNSYGESYISYVDFAIALVDEEIENKEHINERFTVVGERE